MGAAGSRVHAMHAMHTSMHARGTACIHVHVHALCMCMSTCMGVCMCMSLPMRTCVRVRAWVQTMHATCMHRGGRSREQAPCVWTHGHVHALCMHVLYMHGGGEGEGREGGRRRQGNITRRAQSRRRRADGATHLALGRQCVRVGLVDQPGRLRRRAVRRGRVKWQVASLRRRRESGGAAQAPSGA